MIDIYKQDSDRMIFKWHKLHTEFNEEHSAIPERMTLQICLRCRFLSRSIVITEIHHSIITALFFLYAISHSVWQASETRDWLISFLQCASYSRGFQPSWLCGIQPNKPFWPTVDVNSRSWAELPALLQQLPAELNAVANSF